MPSNLLTLCGSWHQVLREFNHVNPHDDQEGKIFADTRVSGHVSLSQYTIIYIL